MKKIYLVWFRYKGDTEDRIRGVALNWPRAEQMALNLEFQIHLREKEEVEVGVKSYLHGELFPDPEDAHSRWTKNNFEVLDEDW